MDEAWLGSRAYRERGGRANEPEGRATRSTTRGTSGGVSRSGGVPNGSSPHASRAPKGGGGDADTVVCASAHNASVQLRPRSNASSGRKSDRERGTSEPICMPSEALRGVVSCNALLGPVPLALRPAHPSTAAWRSLLNGDSVDGRTLRRSMSRSVEAGVVLLPPTLGLPRGWGRYERSVRPEHRRPGEQWVLGMNRSVQLTCVL